MDKTKSFLKKLLTSIVFIATFSFSQTNYSLSFDGDDDYVDCGNDASLNVTEDFTIELWFKQTSWDSDPSIYNYLFSKRDGASTDAGMLIFTNGETNKLEFFIIKAENNQWGYVSAGFFAEHIIQLNQWYHVAVTFSGSEILSYETNDNINIYINGFNQNIDFDSNFTGSIPDLSTSPLTIGNRSDLNRSFPGFIDEIRIWDEVRTTTEIIENLFTNLSGSEDNLVGYWNFNEGTGTTAEDGSPNSNDGTIYGATWIDYVINTGCIYSDADNYDPDATHNDCSCTYDNQENLSLDFIDGDDVDFQSNISFPSSSGLTISFWAKRSPISGELMGMPRSSLNWNKIITFGDNSNYTIWSAQTSGGGGKLNFLGAANYTSYMFTDDSYEDWVHIACVADLDSAKIYVDQELVAVSDHSHSEFILNDEPSMINGYGLIDEVVLWNRSLSYEEVFGLSYGAIDINDPYLVGYWDFNQSESDCFDPIRLCCSSDTLYDRSTNGYDGIINGGIWTFDGISYSLYPEITNIDDQEIEEDGSMTLEISATSPMGLDMTFSVYSDTSDVILSLDNTTLTATPEPDWYGTANVTVMVTDENDLSDTTDFTLTVTPVNDSPEDFNVLYPTVSDTFSTHVESDTAIVFNWEESYDVDSDVTYTLTIELEFFGNTYTDVHENISDTAVSVSSNSLDALLNVTSQDIATFTYYVNSSDGEYMVASDVGEFVLFRAALGVNEGLSVPVVYALHQNYPNPFNPITTLRYDLPEDALVNITIYDMMGRIVSNLVSSQQNAGYKSIQWNATNNQGQPVSAGLYLYTIQAGNFRQTKKMVLLK